MSPTIEEQIERLKSTIVEMEAQREALGDSVVQKALDPLREKLGDLNRLLEASKLPTPKKPLQQRKLLTILFMDIVGSTSIIQHMDPEDVSEIFDVNLKRLAQPVNSYDGRVTSFTGDGFMAIFGAPTAREDDPERAVRAGLAVIQRSGEIAKELEKEWNIHDFKVRVGINTGLVILGGETEGEDTTKGPAVHLAARLQSAAPPGGMLVSHDTYQHIRGVFDVEAWEPLRIKGFDEPVRVYRILRAKPRAFHSYTRGVEGVETRMVGRHDELKYLQDALLSAIEYNEGQVVTIIGEAGVGKSRLLYEFQNWIELLPPPAVRFYEGRAHQEGQGMPLAMLRDLFEFRFQLQENDTQEAVREKVESGFLDVFRKDDEGQMRAHILGQWLGFDFSTSQHLKGVLKDPEQLRNRGRMYLSEYFRGLCSQSPVAVFLEDIHWADDSSLDALDWLGERLHHQCLLFVCAARHSLLERRPYWGEGLAYHHCLELEPLSRRESYQLVGEILKLAGQVPPELFELVVEGAEGNPFYVEELVKMLVEDGVVVKGEESWQVIPERLSEIKVPPTLAGVLQARLESLPSEEQQVLQQASVVGRLFWDRAVAHIQAAEGGRPQGVHEALVSLRGKEMVYRREASAFTDAREYLFKHDILREVTYESVLKRLRRRYHGLVADWLIAKVSDRAGEYCGLIARHLLQAGRKEQACAYFLQAGEGALASYANAEAESYISQALALVQQDDLVRRYNLLKVREKVRNRHGDYQAQKEDLSLLLEIAETLDDKKRQAEVALRQMIYLYDTNDFSGTMKMSERALDLAKTAGDLEIEASINLRSGMSLWQQGQNKLAYPKIECALALALDNQFHQLEADSLRQLGNVYANLGDLAQSQSFCEQALAKYREIGDRGGEATVLNNLGVNYSKYLGDFDQSRGYFEQFLKISREIGDRKSEALAVDNLGMMAFWSFDFDRAINLLSEALDIHREVGNTGMVGRGCKELGYCYLSMGEYDQAKAYYDRALELTHELGYLLEEITTLIQCTEYYFVLGDFERSESYYNKVISNWGDIDDKETEVWKLVALSLLRHYSGDNQAAREHIRQALHIMGDQRHILRWKGLTILGHSLTALGELAEAEEIYRQAMSLGYETSRSRQSIDALAGLARVSMARGDIEQALNQVELILTYLDTETPSKGHTLDGTIEPVRIYTTCYQVLKANKDNRAHDILDEAHNLLQKRAATISDKEQRHSFLHNVPAHCEIVAEFARSQLPQ
jgi:predicted ATPase/class 3 adenylate cyclase/Flp pilus assembly protein TadD